MPNIVGTDNLVKHLDTLHISKLDLLERANSKYSIASFCKADGDIKEQLLTYLELQTAQNNLFQSYFVRLIVEGAKAAPIGFTFALAAPAAKLVVNGSTAPVAPAERYYELFLEVGTLRAENKQLETEIYQLRAEIDELELELEEIEAAKVTGTPESQLAPYLSMIGQIKDIFNPTLAPNIVNGTNDMELLAIVTELEQLDENLKDNLFKLLKLAKNKPMIYKMAITQLNSLV